MSLKVLARERCFLGAHEMQQYLNGASKEGLIVGSAVFQQVAEEYVTRRVQHKKRRLAWRTSRGARRSLGWIPFKARSLQYRGGHVHCQGRALGLWDSYGLAQYQMRAGCFAEDARERWYLNVTVEVMPPAPRGAGDSLGIDLSLKEFATLSSPPYSPRQMMGLIHKSHRHGIPGPWTAHRRKFL